jgi:hypothetical protein
MAAACSGTYVGAGGDGGTSTDGGSTPTDAPSGDALGGQLSFLDDDANDFGAGTFEGTQYQQGHLVLGSGVNKGRFVSRVHDAQREVTFRSLRFVPGAAYSKHLPKKKSKETGYPSFAADMAENVLLLDFDGTSGALLPNGTKLADGSGSGNDAIVDGTGESTAQGPWGTALRDGPSGYAHAHVTASSGLNIGTADATWALWVKTTQSCPASNPPSGNRVYLGIDEGASDKTHTWFGCSSLGACSNSPGGRLGGTFCARQVAPDDCADLCGAKTVNDGNWHHMALVKRGHSPGTIRTFVDGRPDGPEARTQFATAIAFAEQTELGIGAFSGGSYQAEGDFDEVAIWRRALSDAEILGIYRRSALSAGLRARVCRERDCSDAPKFVGPGGGDAAFTDPDGDLVPPGELGLTLPRGRYVQYEVVYSALTPMDSPEILSVELRAE